MTETQILEIIKNVKRLHSLVNQFRKSPNVSELMIFLNSDNDQIIEIGVYIAEEISIDKASALLIVPRLNQLLSHPNSSIRFHAIGALFPFLDRSDHVTREMMTKLSRDSNRGIRLSAEAALKRMS